jgi:hypothetical protein
MSNQPKRRTSGLGLTESEAAAGRDILAATSAYIASVTQSMAQQIKEAGGKLPSRFVIPPQRLDRAPPDTEIHVEIVFASDADSHKATHSEVQ